MKYGAKLAALFLCSLCGCSGKPESVAPSNGSMASADDSRASTQESEEPNHRFSNKSDSAQPFPFPEVHVDVVSSVPVTGSVVDPDVADKTVAAFADPINALLQNIAAELSVNRATGVSQQINFVVGNDAIPATSFKGEETICRFGEKVEYGKVNLNVDGVTITDGQFEDGKRTGAWTYWDLDGNKQFEAEYFEGVKHGRWIAWDNHGNGEKISEGQFQHGKKHGKWVYWGHAEYSLKDLPEPDITDPLQRALRGLEQARAIGERTVVLEETWEDGQLTDKQQRAEQTDEREPE